MHQEPARIVLVTGGSRGIGAEVAQQLASSDTHIVVNYRERVERAESIAQAIRSAGGHASTLRADISDEAQSAAMIDTIAARFGRLDTLVLNASVGPALGVDLGYAKRLNRDAQRRIALRAVPLMPAGGRIVFVTSHAAHFFPHRAVPKGQTAIAASKWAGETALYAIAFGIPPRRCASHRGFRRSGRRDIRRGDRQRRQHREPIGHRVRRRR